MRRCCGPATRRAPRVRSLARRAPTSPPLAPTPARGPPECPPPGPPPARARAEAPPRVPRRPNGPGRRRPRRGPRTTLARDGADDPAVLAQARRLLLGLDRPDLEEVLERAGRDALSSDPAALASARADFERVAAHDDALWEAHFGIGLVARQTEDGALAARELRRALNLVPDQP